MSIYTPRDDGLFSFLSTLRDVKTRRTIDAGARCLLRLCVRRSPSVPRVAAANEPEGALRLLTGVAGVLCARKVYGGKPSIGSRTFFYSFRDRRSLPSADDVCKLLIEADSPVRKEADEWSIRHLRVFQDWLCL